MRRDRIGSVTGLFLVPQNVGGGGSPLARDRGDPPPESIKHGKQERKTVLGLDPGPSADLAIG